MRIKTKNFYFIGKVMGGHRTENFISVLLNSRIPVYYNSFKTNGFFFSWINILLLKISNLVSLVLADVVVMPAMCNDYRFEFKAAVLLKKVILTDFYISLYDTHVLDKKPLSNGVVITPNSPSAEKLIEIDKELISKSDYTFFLNSTEAKYYLNLLNLKFDSNKHVIMPICTDEKDKCDLKYYQDLNSNRCFNICWWGSYIPLHGLEKIIRAAKVLMEKYDLDFHLHLFGTSDKKSLPYHSLIKDLSLLDFITIYNDKTFSNGKLGNFLKHNCDLVLGNFGDSGKARSVLANKIIDGVAMKAPVLTQDSEAPRQFFGETGIFYTSNTSEAIARSIFEISEMEYTIVENRVVNAYNIYRSNFSYKAFNNRINDFIQNL